MRSEFEKLPIIQEIITDEYDGLMFDERFSKYLCPSDGNEEYLNGAWMVWKHQQTKVDELQKKNAWLSDVAERENKRANKLQEEKVSTTTLLGKTIQEKNELQKRVDAVKQLIQEYRDPPTEDKTFQHALSIAAYELEQALKGEQP